MRLSYSGPIKKAGDAVGVTKYLRNIYDDFDLDFETSKEIKIHVLGTTFKTKVDSAGEEHDKREFFKGEEPIFKDLLSNMRKEDIFWDVGSAAGYYTCVVGKKFPDVTIHSFEPVPDNKQSWEENVRKNNVSAELHQFALLERNGSFEMTKDGKMSADMTSKYDDEITVECDKGDEIAENIIPKPTVAKIDTEGNEVDVLKGFSDLLDNSLRLLYIEVHNQFRPNSFSEVKDILENKDFEITVLGERGDVKFIRCEKHIT
jgi:FkbM family methyltransferase